MVATRQQLVSAALQKKMTWGPGGKAVGVAVHMTGNRSKGANAAAHANLQSGGNVRSASWNWTVDDTEAVQSFPNGVMTWHAGSAGKPYVAVEICVNSDGDIDKAVQNAVELIQWLRTTGVGNAIVTHQELTGKYCPTELLDGVAGGVSSLVSRVNGTPRPPAPKPPAPAPSGALRVDGFIGAASTKRWQQVMGTAADGVISGQGLADRPYHVRLETVRYERGGSTLVRAVQRRVGASVDGFLGPNTIKAIQRHLGVTQDGYFGPTTAKALQTVLNTGKF